MTNVRECGMAYLTLSVSPFTAGPTVLTTKYSTASKFHQEIQVY